MQNKMEGTDFNDTAKDTDALGKYGDADNKTNTFEQALKQNGDNETDAEEKEVDEVQETKADVHEWMRNNESAISIAESPCIEPVEEKPKFRAGDTVIHSKPFAFIIYTSHRQVNMEEKTSVIYNKYWMYLFFYLLQPNICSFCSCVALQLFKTNPCFCSETFRQIDC